MANHHSILAGTEDRRDWRATVCGVAESRTLLRTHNGKLVFCFKPYFWPQSSGWKELSSEVIIEYNYLWCVSLLALSSNYHTITLISHASKVKLKILQARLQQYVNEELPYVQPRFRKGRIRNQIANIHCIIGKAREFHKNIYFYFTDYAKAFDCVESQQTGKFLEMGIPDHLTCLLWNLYAGQEGKVRNGHGTMDWFQMGKGVC